MKRKIILSVTFWLAITCVGYSQTKDHRHEVSAAGGYIFMHTDKGGKEHGFSLAAFYQYTFNRLVGIQTGMQYNQVDLVEKSFDEKLHSQLQVPLYAVLFPNSRYNLLGGLYYERILDKLTKAINSSFQKKDVWGYGLGVRRNWKYAKLRLEFKQGFNPWFERRPEVDGGGYTSSMSWSINASIEIPLWRN